MIRLRLPALRERREDIPMLTRHFLQQSAKQLGVEPKRISDAALAQLASFGFPGNVRQLENICHWLTVMAPAQLIEPKDLPPEVALARRRRRSAAPAAPRPVQPRAGMPCAPPMDGGRAGRRGDRASRLCRPRGARGWETGLEAEAHGPAGQRPPRRVGRADAALRVAR